MAGGGGTGPPTTANGGPAQRRIPTAADLIAAARSDPAFAARLPPSLQSALASGDTATIQATLDAAAAGAAASSQGGADASAPSQDSIDRLNADPFDPAAQAAIEARVRQAAVDASLETALEHHPEAFADVVMLYVQLTVNGVTLPAFVDSGAQRSIMSLETAAEAGLSHLIDKRFEGTAVGVGSGKIVGRVHAVPCAAGTGPGAPFLTISLTIMDQPGMPFLLGLDMLKRFRASIDLGAPGGGLLRFPAPVSVDLPFLPEHALPKKARAGGSGFNPDEATAAAAAKKAEQAGPAPAAAGPAPAAPPSASVARLVDLGFSPAAAQAALNAAGGNEEMAASLLFEGMG